MFSVVADVGSIVRAVECREPSEEGVTSVVRHVNEFTQGSFCIERQRERMQEREVN